jgi:hypothetical protein
MNSRQTLKAAQKLADHLKCGIVPSETRGYYTLEWIDRVTTLPPNPAKASSLLCRLLFLATTPQWGLTHEQAGAICGLTTMPSVEGLAGWEELILIASLPASVREGMTRRK